MNLWGEPEDHFYEARGLPRPEREARPVRASDIARALETASAPVLVLGTGGALRAGAIGERRFDALHLSGCDAVLEVDQHSGLARVEAGLTWGGLQEAMGRLGLGLQRAPLMPWGATIGGLLSATQPPAMTFGEGALPPRCSGLMALTASGLYTARTAPRKASGPDLRHLFIGAEGALGVILEVTIAVAPLQPGRLYQLKAPDVGALLEQRAHVAALGLRVSWSCWREGEHLVAAHGPEALLRAADDAMRRALGDALQIALGPQEATTRRALERAWPARRDAPGASRRVLIGCAIGKLDALARALTGRAQLEALRLGQHEALLCASLHEATSPLPLDDATHWQLARDDRTVRWPQHAAELKTSLDPHRRLAVGP